MINVSNALDHRSAVAQLVQHYGWMRGAELGVGSGKLSRMLLKTFPQLMLIGVDTMRRPHRAKQALALQDQYYPRYTLLQMCTANAANAVKDGALDFIFIDAGHSYNAVSTDIQRWSAKVRQGGAILGHDYGHPKYPGVAQAVHERFGNDVELLGHHIWGVSC